MHAVYRLSFLSASFQPWEQHSPLSHFCRAPFDPLAFFIIFTLYCCNFQTSMKSLGQFSAALSYCLRWDSFQISTDFLSWQLSSGAAPFQAQRSAPLSIFGSSSFRELGFCFLVFLLLVSGTNWYSQWNHSLTAIFWRQSDSYYLSAYSSALLSEAPGLRSSNSTHWFGSCIYRFQPASLWYLFLFGR